MPIVSIILPYYKKINYIKKTINSILNQSFKNFEIILVYDDENLNDLSLIEKDFKDNPKITILINKKNLGAGVSRNIGIKHSKGEIIAFIDADDLWKPNKLERQIDFMKSNNYFFTFCNYEKLFTKKKIVSVRCKKHKLNYYDLLNSNEIGLSTVQLNKSIIPDNLFPSLKTKEDYVAWLKITKNNTEAYNLPENLVVWNNSYNSLSSNFIQKFLDGYRVYRDYEKFNIIKSICCLIILSLNSIKRKI